MDILKVLIVDDEPGMRRGALKTLRRFSVRLDEFDCEVSFELDEAESGEQTIEMLEKKKYDLVLLDYKLPGMSGLDILGRIKDNNYDLLAIMMTAYASLEVAVSATKNGAFDFLAKPFTPEELKAVIQKASTNLILQRHARKLEEEKKQVRFQFLSVLSHELKTPLNAIEGYLKIFEDKILGHEIEKYDKMISRSLVRISGMRKLIFDLLDLTRIESGQKVRKVSLINMIDAVKISMENVYPLAQEKEVSVNLHAEDKVMMFADTSELEIMFNNLLSNSVKYNKDGGSVDIHICKEESKVQISIADTGIGMSEEEVGKLFKEFVRFKNDKTRNIEGSGLGLSILKRLTSLYNGKIWAESTLDEGTTFHVELLNESGE